MSLSALSTAVTALRASKYKIEVTSHNVANAGSDGFHRQRVETQPGVPRATPYGPLGTGVDIVGVSRTTDAFADMRARATLGEAAGLTTRADIARRAESALDEPDNGVTASLARIWTAFANWSSRPADAASRQTVMSSLDDLASRVNAIRGTLDGLADDAATRLGAELRSVNDLTARVAQINALGSAGMPPDMADERDLALDRLAELTGAHSTIHADGTVRVTIGGMPIVDGIRSTPLRLDATAGPGVVLHPGGPVTLGGTTGGLQQALQRDLPGFRARLDDFVTRTADALNTAHAANLRADGAPGGDLLVDAGGVLSVAPTAIGELAAADAAGGVLNGRGAEALANLRGIVDGFAREMVNSIGGDVAMLRRIADTATKVSETAVASRDGLTGVNLDEEMSQLIADQHAYAAAARIVTTVDEMLNVLMNM
jgi:flagellar hook-associated protein 1 FlgK